MSWIWQNITDSAKEGQYNHGVGMIVSRIPKSHDVTRPSKKDLKRRKKRVKK